MAALGQDATICRGESREITYLVPLAAGIVAARYYVAAGYDTLAGDRLVSLAAPGDPEITVTDAGSDLLVSVQLTAVHTEGLPVGPLHAELWLVPLDGNPVQVARGVLTVRDSLAN